MQKWTYQVIHSYIDEAMMNELGADGWELVAVVALGIAVSYYFKRPVD